MAQYGLQIYRITHSRLKRSLCTGMKLALDGSLIRDPMAPQARCLMARLDSNTKDCPWGRLSLEKQLNPEQVLTIKVFASNDSQFVHKNNICDIDQFLLDDSEPLDQKENLFLKGGGTQLTGTDDMLLFGQVGRYLWIWVELSGMGEGKISNMRVHVPGDNFYATFPQVYQNEGEFFHRYMAIYSTMYNDMQEKVANIHKLIQVETAPKHILYILAGWLGLEVEEAQLTEEELRKLLLCAYDLLSIKGTSRCIHRLIRLFVTEDIYIVERNQLSHAQLEDVGEQYGTTPFDCRILINRGDNEVLRNKLTVLVHQFAPFRSRIQIVFVGEGIGLDDFSYLDINSKLVSSTEGSMDDGRALTGQIYLN